MRLAGSTVMLALLLGAAPALTQESPGILPTPAQSEAKAARAQAGKHALRRKAAPHIAAPETVSAKTVTPEPAPVRSEPVIAESAEVSPGDRLKIQSALLWSGDYTGSLGGEDPFLSAIKNYQKRAKSKITGILSPSERTNLLAAAKSHEDEFGWTIVTDPSTGARLGLPAKLVPQVRDAARGTRWSAAHGEVQVETFRIPESEIKLAALFEQQKKEPANRKVESSALRDDGFTIINDPPKGRAGIPARLEHEVKGEYTDVNPPKWEKGWPHNDTEALWKNFLQCIRTREKPQSDIETCVRATVLAAVARNAVSRHGRILCTAASNAAVVARFRRAASR
jgi:hypothetical protein